MLFAVLIGTTACNNNDGFESEEYYTSQNYSTETDNSFENSLFGGIPPFSGETFSIVLDSENSVIVEYNGVTKEQFEEYKTICEDNGFYLDGFISDEFYIASDSDGYVITVVFSEEKMMIEIDAPDVPAQNQ